jgi:hypothetical protein
MVTKQRKRRAIVFAGIAIVAMVMLAASFPSLQLSREWHALPQARQTEEAAPAAPEPAGIEIPADLYAAMLIVSLALMVAVVIVGLVSPKTRKRMIRNLILILGLTAIVFALRSPPETPMPAASATTVAVPFRDATVPTSVPGAASPDFDVAAAQSPWLGWGIAIGVALLIATALVLGAWFVWRATHPPGDVLEAFAEQAQQALDALQAGADPKDTVLRCYLEMSRVLRKQRGIVRNQAMTPREFETSLQQAGLPSEQVRQLTRLFETVRYGGRVPGGDAGRQAIDCLSAIARACRATP